MLWCLCEHEAAARDEHLDEGFCDVCGLPERDYFVGQVHSALCDLPGGDGDEQRVEVLRIALAEAEEEEREWTA